MKDGQAGRWLRLTRAAESGAERRMSVRPFMIGPAPVRRTLQYLNSGALKLKKRVSIIEVHYNMYWRFHKTQFSMEFREPKMKESVTQNMVHERIRRTMELKENYSFAREPDNHTGMREFYFWEVPRLQYQNPDVQMVRFLERSPLPFLRIWLNDGADFLIDCDNRDRTSILNQVIRTVGTQTSAQDADALKKSRMQSVSALPMTDPTVGNPATFGFSRTRYCMCEVPDQVPCPGVCPLPLRMRGKYILQKKDELDAWENDLDRPYPTGEEMERDRVSFPVRQLLPVLDVKGLDTVFMRKNKQKTRPFQAPEAIAARLHGNRFDKESDKKLIEDHKK